jgi:hypothetical protein
MDEDRTDGDEDRPSSAAASGEGRPTVVDLDDPADAGVGDEAPPRPPIEPESVDPEHAAFVALGAALTVVVVAGLV